MRRAILLAGMSIAFLSACPDNGDDSVNCERDNGGCNANAACVNRAGSVLCICKPDHVGNGYSCSKTGLQMNAPWPAERGNAAHTGQSIYVGSQTGQLAWHFKTEKADDVNRLHRLYPPIIGADGTVYAGCAEGTLYAISPNGNGKWTFTPDSVFGHMNSSWSTPAIGGDGLLFVTGESSGWLYAVDTAGSGAVDAAWAFDNTTEMEVTCSPVIGANGTVYASAISPNGTPGKLYAFDPLLHAPDWSFDIVDGPLTTPAIASDGTLYVVGDLATPETATLYAIQGDPPVLKWSYAATGCSSATSPAIGPDGTVYVVYNCVDGVYRHAELFALDPSTNDSNGKLKWTWALPDGSGLSKALAVDADGTVYFAGGKWPLYALNPNAMAQGNTTPKWTFSDTNNNSSPYLGSPAIGADGMIYVTDDERIHAIKDGNRVWYYDVGATHSTPAIGADGTVYVASDDGYIYAFRD